MPWLNVDDGGSLALEDLRGRVVLIRFWTDTCPFCRATAPALARIDAEYRARGVTVIGLYHPKPRPEPGEPPRSTAHLAEVVRDWGWRFAVGLDLEWKALDAFWLDHAPRDATSVSFVLDRRGVIRHVHPGPEWHHDGPADHGACRDDYAAIVATVEALLTEPAP